MNAQLIDNWNDLYAGENVPQWEDLEPNVQFCDFVLENSDPSMRVLELGSGLGHNAVYLAQNGLRVTASDLSMNAVSRCGALVKSSGVKVNCVVLDIMNLSRNLKPYDLVVEKGCWHTFFDDDARTRFSNQVYTLLCESGLWISSSGSADNADDPGDPHRSTYPRLTLQQIAAASEKIFEIVKIQKGSYGSNEGIDFLTWECLFRKRANESLNTDKG